MAGNTFSLSFAQFQGVQIFVFASFEPFQLSIGAFSYPLNALLPLLRRSPTSCSPLRALSLSLSLSLSVSLCSVSFIQTHTHAHNTFLVSLSQCVYVLVHTQPQTSQVRLGLFLFASCLYEKSGQARKSVNQKLLLASLLGQIQPNSTLELTLPLCRQCLIPRVPDRTIYRSRVQFPPLDLSALAPSGRWNARVEEMRASRLINCNVYFLIISRSCRVQLRAPLLCVL
jgi:hypothetical protein